MPRPDDQQKLHELLEGFIDAIAEQPETAAAFETWDAKLDLSGKARSLARADREFRGILKRKTTAPRRAAVQRTHGEAGRAFRNVAEGRSAADASHGLIRSMTGGALGFGPESPWISVLAFGLQRRFARHAAAKGGWSVPNSPGPDYSPRIGEELTFSISPNWSIRHVRQLLRPPPGHSGQVWPMTLPGFVATVRRQIRRVEKAVKKPGRPAANYAPALRRDGRWLFLVETGRAKVEELAEAYHANKGQKHEAESPSPCDSCIRLVYRQLASARKLLLKTPDRLTP